ncbi:MAG: S16 family serine protease [Actinomycetaceae bacterium]|nr:S16 family serine protease [Actinomycetaceae bacterium]
MHNYPQDSGPISSGNSGGNSQGWQGIGQPVASGGSPQWDMGHPAMFGADGRPSGQPQRRRRSLVVTLGAIFLIPAILWALVFIPVPYIVHSPGPTIDLLGKEMSEETVIAISGNDPNTGQSVVLDPEHQNGDGKGQLRMTTVSESGGPGRRLNSIQLLFGLADQRNSVIPYGDVYPEEITEEQVAQAAEYQMSASHSTSSVAALESLGWELPAKVVIEEAVPGSHAVDVVQSGDVLKTLTTPDGTVHPVDSAAVPFAVMRTVAPDSEMKVLVERGGKDVELTIRSVAPQEDPKEEGSKLGIFLNPQVEMPVEISISLENIGGPSAGMMFALGIIDRLTPGDMTGGVAIAGTGGIGYDGVVSPIGGIRQKMWGAKDDGAQWFLAPTKNCDEVVGHIPEGLKVTKVGTLDEARHAVDMIAQGKGDSLPQCTAP